MRLIAVNVFVSLLLMVLGGCGAGRGYYRNVDTWIGSPVEEMKASWGEPEDVTIDSDGLKKYSWIFKETIYIPPAEYNPPIRNLFPDGSKGDLQYSQELFSYDASYDPGDYEMTMRCTSTALVDSDGRVSDITHDSVLGFRGFGWTQCALVPPPPARDTKP